MICKFDYNRKNDSVKKEEVLQKNKNSLRTTMDKIEQLLYNNDI